MVPELLGEDCHVGCPSTAPLGPPHSGDCTPQEGIPVRILSSQPRQGYGAAQYFVNAETLGSLTPANLRPCFNPPPPGEHSPSQHGEPSFRPACVCTLCSGSTGTQLSLAIQALGLLGTVKCSLIYLPPTFLLRSEAAIARAANLLDLLITLGTRSEHLL